MTVFFFCPGLPRLHPMRKDERVQLGHLANLYSLKMHYIDRERDFICPILTKTSNTTQMDGLQKADADETLSAAVAPLAIPFSQITSENESKRFKK